MGYGKQATFKLIPYLPQVMKSHKLKFLCVFCLHIFCCDLATSQSSPQERIDSLQLIINKTKAQDSIIDLLSVQLGLARQIGDLKKQAQIEIAIGQASDFDGIKMEEHFRNAFKHYQSLSDSSGMIRAMFELTHAKQLQSDYDSTRIYSERLIDLAREAKDTIYVIRARLALSSVYNHLSLYAQSLKELNESRILAESIKDNATLTFDIYNRESFAYYSLGEYDKSAERIEKIIDLFKVTGEPRRLNIWSNNLASVYSLCNCVSLETRKQILRESIRYSEQANFAYGKAFAYKHLADVYREEGILDSSIYYLNSIEELLPEINKKDFTGLVSVAQGFYWEHKGNSENAIKYYRKAHDVWEEIGKQREQMDMAWNLGIFYERKGDYKQAYKYLYTYSSLKDTLYDADNIRKIKELELSYDFRQKQITDSLKNQEKVNLLEYEALSQKKSKNVLFAGILGVLIIVIVVYNSLIKQRKLTHLLEIKSAQVESELNQKELLLTEIHHRVKNNFQILSSLLELQSRGANDQLTKDLISEGKNRVKSMALIHNQLYNTDSLKVKLADYLHSLVSQIQQSFQGNNAHVDFTVDSDYEVDVDNMVPLGLIANELITNAFKYATQEGLKLHIILERRPDFDMLTFKDNGPGLPDNFDLSNAKSTGIWLVSRLALQLHGKYEYKYDRGACFTIYYSQSEYVNG